MVSLFSQAGALPPTWWEIIREGGGLGLAAFVILWLIPRQLRDSREEREKRDVSMNDERTKDREARQEVASLNQKSLDATQTFYLTLMEKMQDRFDGRIAQAFEQMRGSCKFRPPGE